MSNSKKKLARAVAKRNKMSYQAAVNVLDKQRDVDELEALVEEVPVVDENGDDAGVKTIRRPIQPLLETEGAVPDDLVTRLYESYLKEPGGRAKLLQAAASALSRVANGDGTLSPGGAKRLADLIGMMSEAEPRVFDEGFLLKTTAIVDDDGKVEMKTERGSRYVVTQRPNLTVYWFEDYVDMIDAVETHVKKTRDTLLLHEDHKNGTCGFATTTLNGIGGPPMVFECSQKGIGESLARLEKSNPVRAAKLSAFLGDQADRVKLARMIGGEPIRIETIPEVTFDSIGKFFHALKKYISENPGSTVLPADDPKTLRLGFSVLSGDTTMWFYIRITILRSAGNLRHTWDVPEEEYVMPEEEHLFLRSNIADTGGRMQIARWLETFGLAKTS